MNSQYVAPRASLALLLICISSASVVVGMVSYHTSAATIAGVGEARVRPASKSDEDASGVTATQLRERFGNVLGLGPVVKAPQPAAISADPLASFRLAGVVEKDGQQMAVFVSEMGDTQRIISVRRGESVAGDWIVDQIGTTSATLRKAGETRSFTLFD